MKLNVTTLDAKEVGDRSISPTRCSASRSATICLARVVDWQLAKRRAGNHKTKGISDIQGTTKKP